MPATPANEKRTSWKCGLRSNGCAASARSCAGGVWYACSARTRSTSRGRG